MEAFVRSNIDNQNAQYVASSHGEIIGWCDITPFSKQSMSHVGTLNGGYIKISKKRYWLKTPQSDYGSCLEAGVETFRT